MSLTTGNHVNWSAQSLTFCFSWLNAELIGPLPPGKTPTGSG